MPHCWTPSFSSVFHPVSHLGEEQYWKSCQFSPPFHSLSHLHHVAVFFVTSASQLSCVCHSRKTSMLPLEAGSSFQRFGCEPTVPSRPIFFLNPHPNSLFCFILKLGAPCYFPVTLGGWIGGETLKVLRWVRDGAHKLCQAKG